MQATADRILVVAAGLVPARWLPAGSFAGHAPALAGHLRRCTPATVPLTVGVGVGDDPEADMRELAHDRFLAGALGVPLAPGVMSAVRALAAAAAASPLPATATEGWLLEPVRFLLARDHMVLDVDRGAPVDPATDRRLAELIKPLLADEGFELSVLGPGLWWLGPKPGTPDAGWRLGAVSRELAVGRHANDWLPAGPDSRRFRRLLNEIQMTWHAAADDDGAIQASGFNGVWPTGPIPPAAITRWQSLERNGQLQLDDSLLAARLAGEPDRWIDGLAAAVPRWLERYAAAGPGEQAILLCGERTAAWLTLSPSSTTSRAASRRENLLHRLNEAGRHWLGRMWSAASPAPAGAQRPAKTGRASRADDHLERLFSGD